MFSERFLEIPIILINTELSETCGKDVDIGESVGKINIYEIQYYHRATDLDDKECTILVFKGGNSLHIPRTIKEFERILNAEK